VKTPAQNFGNNRISDMETFDKMSRRIQWFQNEFSHSLSPEPTPVGAGRSASRVTVSDSAWLSYFRWQH